MAKDQADISLEEFKRAQQMDDVANFFFFFFFSFIFFQKEFTLPKVQMVFQQATNSLGSFFLISSLTGFFSSFFSLPLSSLSSLSKGHQKIAR